MTALEWHLSNDPEPMINALRADMYQSEFRVFALACTRRVWHLLPETARVAVEIQEEFIAGRASATEVESLLEAASRAALAYYSGGRSPDARAYAESTVYLSRVKTVTAAQLLSVSSCVASAVACAIADSQPDEDYDRVFDMTRVEELAGQAELLRSIVCGPPE